MLIATPTIITFSLPPLRRVELELPEHNQSQAMPVPESTLQPVSE